MPQLATAEHLRAAISTRPPEAVSYSSVLTPASAFMTWDQRHKGPTITACIALFLHLITGHSEGRSGRE